MVRYIEDGAVVTLAELLSGQVKSANGATLTWTQQGTTGTYTSTAALGDGSGKSERYFVDFPPNMQTSIVLRKVS